MLRELRPSQSEVSTVESNWIPPAAFLRQSAPLKLLSPSTQVAKNLLKKIMVKSRVLFPTPITLSFSPLIRGVRIGPMICYKAHKYAITLESAKGRYWSLAPRSHTTPPPKSEWFCIYYPQLLYNSPSHDLPVLQASNVQISLGNKNSSRKRHSFGDKIAFRFNSILCLACLYGTYKRGRPKKQTGGGEKMGAISLFLKLSSGNKAYTSSVISTIAPLSCQKGQLQKNILPESSDGNLQS